MNLFFYFTALWVLERKRKEIEFLVLASKITFYPVLINIWEVIGGEGFYALKVIECEQHI